MSIISSYSFSTSGSLFFHQSSSSSRLETLVVPPVLTFHACISRSSSSFLPCHAVVAAAEASRCRIIIIVGNEGEREERDEGKERE